jgi:hypothetical protein
MIEELIMIYRIEVAEFHTHNWVNLGLVEQTIEQLRMYLCVVRRMYPGSHVRAIDPATKATVAET